MPIDLSLGPISCLPLGPNLTTEVSPINFLKPKANKNKWLWQICSSVVADFFSIWSSGWCIYHAWWAETESRSVLLAFRIFDCKISKSVENGFALFKMILFAWWFCSSLQAGICLWNSGLERDSWGFVKGVVCLLCCRWRAEVTVLKVLWPMLLAKQS